MRSYYRYPRQLGSPAPHWSGLVLGHLIRRIKQGEGLATLITQRDIRRAQEITNYEEPGRGVGWLLRWPWYVSNAIQTVSIFVLTLAYTTHYIKRGELAEFPASLGDAVFMPPLQYLVL